MLFFMGSFCLAVLLSCVIYLFSLFGNYQKETKSLDLIDAKESLSETQDLNLSSLVQIVTKMKDQ